MSRTSGWDSLLLCSETPNVHQHTLKVAVVDTSRSLSKPTFEQFREMLHRRLPALEPLRRQLVDIPLRLHRPMWRDDVEADLAHHVRRVRVPAPGGRRGLDALVGEIASTSLERNRPLWEVYYAEGVGEHEFAVIAKLHHALADGVASANLMEREMAALGVPLVPRATLLDAAAPTRALLREAGRDHLQRLRVLPSTIGDAVAGGYKFLQRKRGRRRPAELAGRLRPPSTFLNHKLSPGRTFATATLPLDEIKATSRNLGITVNDLVLTIAAGALRQLLQKYDGRAEEPLVGLVPAVTDASPDRVTGNALDPLFVALPVHVADPLERARLTRASTQIAKENHELLGPQILGKLLEYVPPSAVRATFGWESRRETKNQLLNVILSNVPGPRERGELSGAVVSEIYSVGPLAAGVGMNLTVWSYVDRLNISVLSDDRTFDDVHDATDAFVLSFNEVRDAAGPARSTA